jgi:hypothetical protein
MPTPTQEELNNAITSVSEALQKVRSVQKGLTYSKKVDKLLNKSYNKLGKVSRILTHEASILP